jgi:hypothetical protein
MTRRDFDTIPNERAVTAPGSKTDARCRRTIFVDEWAWRGFRFFGSGAASSRLFPSIDADGGNLRDAFYEAQVAAGIVKSPERSKKTRKKLWRGVAPHTLHDCRHT